MTDYIDREKAYKAIKNEMESWIGGDKTDYRYVQDAIADILAADVRPVVHGKWVPDDKEITVHCSECGSAEWYINRRKYCSSCGAQMDGGDAK